ncbi:V-type ATPase [Ascodesmis nigricans]|uniref:V-type proton ATPase proteolipid subunit n=1 Tax=Ascodesmis nigricans TaxID=341454 RepID=A0A4S2MN82_9PEZI|nr:V-type ATPase [Ascodesmis nigricans]
MFFMMIPAYAPFFGVMGCVAATIFTSFGAAYGTARSGVGLMVTGSLKPDLIIKGLTPIILSGILSIYGLVVSILISTSLTSRITLFSSFTQFGAGLVIGFAGLAAGFTIGIVGDAGVRGCANQPKLFVGMVLVLIFAEVLALYGFVVGLVLVGKGGSERGGC